MRGGGSSERRRRRRHHLRSCRPRAPPLLPALLLPERGVRAASLYAEESRWRGLAHPRGSCPFRSKEDECDVKQVSVPLGTRTRGTREPVFVSPSGRMHGFTRARRAHIPLSE